MSVKDQEELPLGDQPAAPKKKKRKRLGTTSLNKTCQTLLTSNPPAQDVNKTTKPSSIQKIWQGIRTPTIQLVREIKQEYRKQIITLIVTASLTALAFLAHWVGLIELRDWWNSQQKEDAEITDSAISREFKIPPFYTEVEPQSK